MRCWIRSGHGPEGIQSSHRHSDYMEYMRLRYLIPAFLIVCVAAGGAVTAHAAADRQRTFADGAARLRAQWDVDQSQGVPAASLAPLRKQLESQAPTGAWWSPGWIDNDGRALLARLDATTRT